jgi:hypothetical protein
MASGSLTMVLLEALYSSSAGSLFIGALTMVGTTAVLEFLSRRPRAKRASVSPDPERWPR